MGFLEAFNAELEKQLDYFTDKEDYQTSKRSQTMMFSMDKIAKTIENSFENGSYTPDAFIKQLNTFINLDKNNLNVFQKIKFGKGVLFVKNRLEMLEEEKINLQKVIDGGDF